VATIVTRSVTLSIVGALLLLMGADAEQSRGPDRMGVFHLSGGEQDLSGYLASALVLATFSARSMRQLRTTAIASDVAFIVHAMAGHLYSSLILHGLLLPLNTLRLEENLRAIRRIARGDSLDRWPCPSA
jgi:hypothetical protein